MIVMILVVSIETLIKSALIDHPAIHLARKTDNCQIALHLDTLDTLDT